MEISYGDVLIVIIVAVLAPVLANLAPRLRLPAVALEIVLGVLIGPQVLGLVEMDATLTVLSTFGLGYLLFLAGLELDLTTLRGRTGVLFGSWAISCVLALAFGGIIHLLDVEDQALLVAIALASTSLGLVVPVLREAGHSRTLFGQTVMGASSIAEFGALLLLTLFYSGQGVGTGQQILLIALFCVMTLIVGLTVAGVGRVPSVWPSLERLADTSSQLSVRAVLVVFLVFLALATHLGLEAILGAFIAGALLRFLDRERHLENPSLRPKIEAIGYGFLVPVFFVTSGVQVDLEALIDSPRYLALIPVFVVAMLVVRGTPSLLFRRFFDRRQIVASAFLQATNLTFIVVVSSLGVQTGALDAESSAALLAAGVLSVLIYPPIAAVALSRTGDLQPDWDEPEDTTSYS
jgi:Kef-type K+ transport system membrane component KefB